IVGSQQFREANPYVKYKRQFENWTPFQILDFFVQSYMEPWFMERIRFHVDPAANVMRTYDVPVFKWIVDESGPEPTPILVATIQQKSGMGTQVFRLPTWGSL